MQSWKVVTTTKRASTAANPGGFFITRKQTIGAMNRDDYVRIAQRYDTTIADAMLRACGVVRTAKQRGKVKHSESHKYRGVRKLMNQKHGVRL